MYKLLLVITAFLVTANCAIVSPVIKKLKENEFQTGCEAPQSVYQQKILSFLLQDRENGKERNRKLGQIPVDKQGDYIDDATPSYADVISEYATKMGSLDLSELPIDFQNAWKRHVHAWRTHAEFFASRRKDVVEQKGKLTKKRKSEFDNLGNQIADEINASWEEVQSIAAKYGAVLPGEDY